jgi:hypothetical protein
LGQGQEDEGLKIGVFCSYPQDRKKILPQRRKRTRMRTILQRRKTMRQLKVLIVVLIMSLSLFAAESPFSGTWKLNLAKSKLSPPVPKSDIMVVDADENGLKFNEDVIDDKGEALKISYEAKFDGKDYPVTGDPSSDSVSYRRVNANTLKGTLKKSGKVVYDATGVVSKDGKITTVNYTDYSQGKPAKGTAVYDKQ